MIKLNQMIQLKWKLSKVTPSLIQALPQTIIGQELKPIFL